LPNCTVAPASNIDKEVIMRKTSKPVQAERDGRFGKGHGTGALGPSDTSDSGSDIQGGPGLSQDDVAIGLDTGTTSDPDRRPRRTAGPDVGDANLDSDSDAAGTGEHATAGRDYPWEEGADISTDTVVDSPDESIAEEVQQTAPRGKSKRRPSGRTH